MFHRKSLAALTAAVAVSTLVGSANASAIVYEPFAQTSGGNLNNTAAGTGLSGNWSANGLTINSGSLSYGSLPTSGNQVFDSAPGGGDQASVSTGTSLGNATTGLLSDGSTLWFSFLVNAGTGSNDKQEFTIGTDGIGSMFSGILANSGSGFGVRIEKGQIYAASFSGGAITKAKTNGGLGGSTTQLIVGEFISGATGSDADTLNLYTPSSSDLSSMGSVVSTVSAALDQGSFSTLAFGFRGGGGSASASLDEIRVGGSYADVSAVPEPASLALMGLGGLLLVARRRRLA